MVFLHQTIVNTDKRASSIVRPSWPSACLEETNKCVYSVFQTDRTATRAAHAKGSLTHIRWVWTAT